MGRGVAGVANPPPSACDPLAVSLVTVATETVGDRAQRRLCTVSDCANRLNARLLLRILAQRGSALFLPHGGHGP